MFNCLANEELDFLAQRALLADYQADEVILDEGGRPVDKVYLVLQGSVQCEASSLVDHHELRSIGASLGKTSH